jgi:beta-glucosidase
VLTPAIAANHRALVAVDLTNSGARAGDEVVQLYLHDDEASVTRPVIELVRFARVTVQPGERRTITFTLNPDDLALWDAYMDKVVERGTFTLYSGPNSVDLKSAKLTVTGSSPLVLQGTSSRVLP